MLERALHRQRIEKRRRHRDQSEIDTPDPRHRRLFVIGDDAAAVAEENAEAVIERDQKGDRAFGDDAFVGRTAGADFGALLELRRRQRRRGGLQGMLERLDHLMRRLAVTAEYRLDLEALELQHFAAAPGHCAYLFHVDVLRGEFFRRHRRTDHDCARARTDRRRIRHVIDVAMAEQNDIGAFHIGRLEAKGGIQFAAVEIGVEQNDLAVVDQFEIGITGPAHRQRLRIARKRAAGRHQFARAATRVAAGIGAAVGDACAARVNECAAAQGTATDNCGQTCCGSGQ